MIDAELKKMREIAESLQNEALLRTLDALEKCREQRDSFMTDGEGDQDAWFAEVILRNDQELAKILSGDQFDPSKQDQEDAGP